MSRSATNIAILIAGLIGGWGTALYSIQSFGSATVGVKGNWSTWDAGEGNASNPYAVAHYLLEGQIPPATGLFRAYFASRDDEGNALDASCVYSVNAPANELRWWSFASGRDGGEATAITSDAVLANAQGDVSLTVSPSPQSGNWVQPPSSGRLEFAFMIAHDGKLAADDASILPTIQKVGC